MYDAEDTDLTPAVVTESGRPRRAAAPTFGDNGTDTEPATSIMSSARRNAAKDSSGEASAEKPTRGRKSGAGQKGQRRTKAQIQAAAAQQVHLQQMQQAQQGQDSPSRTSTIAGNRESQREMVLPFKTPLGLSGEEFVLVQPTRQPDTDRQPPTLQSEVSVTSNGSPNTTSYWSVPEQQKFPDLVAYYGKNFDRIASFMKTKTPMMVSHMLIR